MCRWPTRRKAYRRISLQFTDEKYNGTAWYWTYKQASDIPDPNNITYSPQIYVRAQPSERN